MSDATRRYLDHMSDTLGLTEDLLRQIAAGGSVIVKVVADDSAPFVRLIEPEDFYLPADAPLEASPRQVVS